jgi:phytoene dehydrogenase-like protein
VPYGCETDVSARIDAQIERFAPGFGALVLARRVSGPAELAATNANLEGGDISGGRTDLLHLIARPVLSFSPYRMRAAGLYLCSSSTPPGGGVHGMCGHLAARAALSRELR